MPDDAPSDSRSSHSWTWWALWLFFSVFIIYPLSLGPAIRLHDKGVLRSEIEVLYKPIEILYRQSPFCSRIIDAYLDLWHVD